MPAPATKVNLNDKRLQNLKPAPDGKRVTVWDAMTPHLGVRMSAKGKRSFVVVKRAAGRTKLSVVTLGTYPSTTLAVARERARRAIAELDEGRHPREAMRRRAENEARLEKNSFGNVAQQFIERHVRLQRSEHGKKNEESAIKRELVSRWGKRPIAEITRADIGEAIEAISDRGAPRMARLVFSYCRVLFGWSLERGIYGLASNPASDIRASRLIGAEKLRPRDRVLSDPELRHIWAAATAAGYSFGDVVRLLLLTGTRRDEVASASWPEIDMAQKMWTIPAERTKTDQVHVVPLSDAALELLEALPRFDDQGTPPAPAAWAAVVKDQVWNLVRVGRTAPSRCSRRAGRPTITLADFPSASGEDRGAGSTIGAWKTAAV